MSLSGIISFTYLILLVPSLSSAYSITLSGTVTSIDSSSKFVYQTGSSKGFVPVSYSASLVSPGGATVKLNQIVTVVGDYTSAGGINATSVKVAATAPPPTQASFSISGKISSTSSTSLLIQTGATCGFMNAYINSSTQYSPSGYLPKAGDVIQISGTKNGISSCGTSIAASKVSGPTSTISPPPPIPAPAPAPSAATCGTGCINYYVGKTNCSDSYSEAQARSSLTPWCSIQTADQKLILGSSGTTVHVLPGTYSGNITTTKNGGSSTRIRFISDTLYGAHLTGSSGDSVLWIAHGANSDIVGFDFDGSVNGNLEAAVVTYSADGTLNVGIKNNKVHNFSNSGNHSGTVSVIASCIIVTSYPTKPCATVIEGNLVYHNNGGASLPVTAPNPDNGIDLGWGDIARNNIVVDQGGGFCMQVAHSSTHNVVTNNTLINCARGGILVGNGGGAINDDTTISNNIIANTGFNCGPHGCSPGLRIYSSGGCGPHNIYASNLMYGNSIGNFLFDNSCSNTSMGTQSGSNLTTFANYTGTVTGDYHLRASSSAIDKGSALCALGIGLCAPPVDFDNMARPRGVTFDIGAYEF